MINSKTKMMKRFVSYVQKMTAQAVTEKALEKQIEGKIKIAEAILKEFEEAQALAVSLDCWLPFCPVSEEEAYYMSLLFADRTEFSIIYWFESFLDDCVRITTPFGECFLGVREAQ